MTKRTGIYSVFDADGIVDRYITTFLDSMIRYLDRLVIVANDKLTDEGRKILSEYTSEILTVSESRYAGGYKKGIEYLGWEYITACDELILFNDTVMGPVDPLDRLFGTMSLEEADFWGITQCHSHRIDPMYDSNVYIIPEYIQTYFLALRRSLVTDESFRQFWEALPDIHDPQEYILRFEAQFTEVFSQKGYKWQVYVHTDDLIRMNHHPLRFLTKELVLNRHCPIFEKGMFAPDHAETLRNEAGNTASEFFALLKEKNLFDTEMIWDNLIRTSYQEDLVNGMNLRYVLSTDMCDEAAAGKILAARKIALMMHIFFEDLIDEMAGYAKNMPPEADIYISTDTEEKAGKIRKAFATVLPDRNIRIRLAENRGRDVGALLVGMKEIVGGYDYICVAHDKKTVHVDPGTVGKGFSDKCFGNTVYNETFVKNVLAVFENEPRCGILSPPVPSHGRLRGLLGAEWGPNYENVKQVAKRLHINAPMCEGKIPVAPYGGIFWFRTKALLKLFEYDWKYSDFPEETGQTVKDGTIIHAIERLYPFAAQDAGYYSGIVMSDEWAGIECAVLDHYCRTLYDVMPDLQEYIRDGFMKKAPPSRFAWYLKEYGWLNTTLTYRLVHKLVDMPFPFKMQLKKLITKNIKK